jgi:ribosomal-protein-alanine N-acetyltransferase
MDDLDRLVEIATRAFGHAWNRESLASEIERSWARVLAAEADDGTLVAFANLWVVADEVHVLNVATDPEHRRRGHARALVEAMISAAREVGARTMQLEVRSSNAAAIRLYESYGFRAVGRRERYYDDGEDAVLMDAPVG